MTRENDRHGPGHDPTHSHLLAPALTILAQFDNETVLDHKDVARLAGCSGLVARRCLATLVEVGYLREAPNGRYRLAGDSEPTCARGGEGGALDTAA
jgi:DNA-binding IscR family transcriptional regulator